MILVLFWSFLFKIWRIFGLCLSNKNIIMINRRIIYCLKFGAYVSIRPLASAFLSDFQESSKKTQWTANTMHLYRHRQQHHTTLHCKWGRQTSVDARLSGSHQDYPGMIFSSKLVKASAACRKTKSKIYSSRKTSEKESPEVLYPDSRHPSI